jgi:hypothetical protein
VLGKEEDGERYVGARAGLKKQERTHQPLERLCEVVDRGIGLCREAKRVISIKGSFDGIAVREFIFEEEGVDEHFLVNPEFTCF